MTAKIFEEIPQVTAFTYKTIKFKGAIGMGETDFNLQQVLDFIEREKIRMGGRFSKVRERRRFFEVYELVDREFREGCLENIIFVDSNEELDEIKKALPENRVLKEFKSTDVDSVNKIAYWLWQVEGRKWLREFSSN